MKIKIEHGKEVDIATPAELARLLAAANAEGKVDRIRARAVVVLDAAGNGQDEVYAVPMGMAFEVRRVVVDLDTASDPSTGNVALNAAGKFVAYLRSGGVIEYGAPSYGAAIQVPGSQSWGAEQGPYLQNGETFEVLARGLTANAGLRVSVEGALAKSAARL